MGIVKSYWYPRLSLETTRAYILIPYVVSELRGHDSITSYTTKTPHLLNSYGALQAPISSKDSAVYTMEVGLVSRLGSHLGREQMGLCVSRARRAEVRVRHIVDKRGVLPASARNLQLVAIQGAPLYA